MSYWGKPTGGEGELPPLPILGLRSMFNKSISHPTETEKSDCHTDSLSNNILETKIVFPEKKLTSTIGNTE